MRGTCVGCAFGCAWDVRGTCARTRVDIAMSVRADIARISHGHAWPGNGSSPGHGVDHVLAAVRLRRPGGAIHPCRLARRASDPVSSPRKQSASKTGKEVSRTTTTTPKTAARLSCRLRGAKAQPRHRVVGDEDGVSKISSIAFLAGARRRGPPPLACHRHLLACHHHPAGARPAPWGWGRPVARGAWQIEWWHSLVAVSSSSR